MTSFEVYEKYVALKRHFHSKNFNYFQYNGKVNVTQSAFLRRNDRFYFKKLAKYRDPVMILVYNLAENDKWIGDICINEESLAIYHRHKKTNQALSYEFALDLAKFDSAREMISCEDNQHPLIIRSYIADKISLETLVLVADIMRPLRYWTKKFPDDPIIEKHVQLIQKFKGFMTYDRIKMKDIFLSNFR